MGIHINTVISMTSHGSKVSLAIYYTKVHGPNYTNLVLWLTAGVVVVLVVAVVVLLLALALANTFLGGNLHKWAILLAW